MGLLTLPDGSAREKKGDSGMNEWTLQTIALHSLAKVFPEIAPSEGDRLQLCSFLENEPFSFQIAYKFRKNTMVSDTIYARISTELPVSFFDVGFVPVFQASAPNINDKYRAGLFPDPLFEKKINPKIRQKRFPSTTIFVEDDGLHISAQSDGWRCVWITINEQRKKLKAGMYPLTVEFFAQGTGDKVGEETVGLKIIPASLPKQKLKYTNWFHCDCLCDAHAVEPFDDRFWPIFADYVKKASLNGMNLLLTPCFTPPLDTPVGKERKTVQLVGVKLENGEYRFDFSLLEKYISVAKKNGIEYFEHSHFFSQWGASSAPKIMATVNGRYQQLFGWKDAAWGKKYTAFLHAYIPALLAFLKQRGWDKRFVFHISDEPSTENIQSYRKAREAVGNLLDGYVVGDALSYYEIYKERIVQTPIVCTDHIHDFYGRANHLWAYYTGGQCFDGLSNRKLNCSGERNRMIGIQMYMHEIEGFLHWGYNFYYDMLSQGVANPYINSCFYSGGNPGTSYLVYPAQNGCVQSIRQKVFYEGINDMRALLLLEKLIGKEKTGEFVEGYFGNVTFFTHPGTATNLLNFRRLLNEKIEDCLAEGGRE